MPVPRGWRRHRTRRLQLMPMLMLLSMRRGSRDDGLSRRCFPSKRRHYFRLQNMQLFAYILYTRVCVFYLQDSRAGRGTLAGLTAKDPQQRLKTKSPHPIVAAACCVVCLRTGSIAVYQETAECRLMLVGMSGCVWIFILVS